MYLYASFVQSCQYFHTSAHGAINSLFVMAESPLVQSISSTHILHYFKSSLTVKLSTFTMITRKCFILALLCSSGQCFTQLTKHSKVNSIRLASSTFDIEASVTNEQRITGENFTPSQEDINAMEAAFGKPTADKRMNNIEMEFPTKRKIKASVRETGTDSMKEYMKSMCNHELLNKNEEIILAREIQILLKWEESRDELENQLLR